MPTTDRLEMLVNLDDTGAEKDIKKIEKRGVKIPLQFREPSARGIMGLGGRGGGRGIGGLGRLIYGEGAAMKIMGGAMVGSSVISILTGQQSTGQKIASFATQIGSIGLFAGPKHPYVMAGSAIIMGAGMLGGALLPNQTTSGAAKEGDVRDLLADQLAASGAPPMPAPFGAAGPAGAPMPAPAPGAAAAFARVGRADHSSTEFFDSLRDSHNIEEIVDLLKDIRMGIRTLSRLAVT